MRVGIIGSFRFPPETMPAAQAAMRKVIEATRAEAGCIQYNYGEDVLDPGLIRVSELWESREHLTAHFAQPHMAAWQAERTALGLSERQITVYELGASEAV